MFGLFKRTKIVNWELQLLRTAIGKLPKEYSSLIDQINDGLFRNVMLDASDIPGYVSFGYNYKIYKKYSKEDQTSYKLTNIEVFDIKSARFLPYEIYVSSGVINGYSLVGNKKSDIDLSKVDVSGFRKEALGVSDYNRIVNLLDEDEKKALSASEVY